MRTNYAELEDSLVFEVCTRFTDDQLATGIGKWLKQNGFPQANRESAYRIVREGRRRGFLQLRAPEEIDLQCKLRTKYPKAGDIRVLNVEGDMTIEHLATRAAEVVISLIREKAKASQPVHIGFGSGPTMQRFTRNFAKLLRSEAGRPKLMLHALTSGCSPRDPTSAPVSFFSQFQELRDIEYLCLFAPAVVDWDLYNKTKDQPSIRIAFDHAEEIDIVVTSLANAEDEHGLLQESLKLSGKDEVEKLRNLGWKGDVLWRPYSETAPIELGTGNRTVVLFEIKDLVRLSDTPGKHVVCIGGPCVTCGKSKAIALRPLMEQPGLRIFNHLVTDKTTAQALITE